MAGYNEIDRVRTPQGSYVGSTMPGSDGKPASARRGILSTIPVPLVLVTLVLLAYGLVTVWSAIQGDPY